MVHYVLYIAPWRSGKRARLRARRVKVRFSLRAIVLSLEKSECNNSGYKLTGLTWWP